MKLLSLLFHVVSYSISESIETAARHSYVESFLACTWFPSLSVDLNLTMFILPS